jgi:hypothetical protein
MSSRRAVLTCPTVTEAVVDSIADKLLQTILSLFQAGFCPSPVMSDLQTDKLILTFQKKKVVNFQLPFSVLFGAKVLGLYSDRTTVQTQFPPFSSLQA